MLIKYRLSSYDLTRLLPEQVWKETLLTQMIKHVVYPIWKPTVLHNIHVTLSRVPLNLCKKADPISWGSALIVIQRQIEQLLYIAE